MSRLVTHTHRKEEGMGAGRFMFYVWHSVLASEALVAGITRVGILMAILDLNRQAIIAVLKALLTVLF